MIALFEFFLVCVRPKPNCEALVSWLRKLADGWLAGEIWLKPAWLTNRLKTSLLRHFCRFQVQLVGMAQTLQQI